MIGCVVPRDIVPVPDFLPAGVCYDALCYVVL